MILGIDTATRQLSIALHSGNSLVAEHTWHSANQHSVELSPAINEMFDKAGIAMDHLKAVAVASGPGSFTGLRIGMSVAKSIALALKIPLIPVATFDIVAQATPYFKGGLYVAVFAGRGRVHIQRYRWQKGGWCAVSEPANTDWESFLGSIDKTAYLTGEIDLTAQNLIREHPFPLVIAPDTQRLRRAGNLIQIALGKMEANEVEDPSFVTPIYLNTP